MEEGDPCFRMICLEHSVFQGQEEEEPNLKPSPSPSPQVEVTISLKMDFCCKSDNDFVYDQMSGINAKETLSFDLNLLTANPPTAASRLIRDMLSRLLKTTDLQTATAAALNLDRNSRRFQTTGRFLDCDFDENDVDFERVIHEIIRFGVGKMTTTAVTAMPIVLPISAQLTARVDVSVFPNSNNNNNRAHIDTDMEDDDLIDTDMEDDEHIDTDMESEPATDGTLLLDQSSNNHDIDIDIEELFDHNSWLDLDLFESSINNTQIDMEEDDWRINLNLAARAMVMQIINGEISVFDQNYHGMVPADESSINNMMLNNKVIISPQLEEISDHLQDCWCVVCLEQLGEVGSQVSQMPCSHQFHTACIQTWLNNSHYCPICRYAMPTRVLN